MEQCHEIIVFVFGEVCVTGMSMIMFVIKKNPRTSCTSNSAWLKYQRWLLTQTGKFHLRKMKSHKDHASAGLYSIPCPINIKHGPEKLLASLISGTLRHSIALFKRPDGCFFPRQLHHHTRLHIFYFCLALLAQNTCKGEQ